MMTRREAVQLVLASAGLSLGGVAVASAQRRRRPPRRGRWVRLGSKQVSDRVETDTIVVTGARGDFTAIKLKVFKRAVEFRDVEIHYANGSKQDVPMRRVIPAGGESRVIDLEGRDRVIKTIKMRYDAQALGGRTARVEVWGRR